MGNSNSTSIGSAELEHFDHIVQKLEEMLNKEEEAERRMERGSGALSSSMLNKSTDAISTKDENSTNGIRTPVSKVNGPHRLVQSARQRRHFTHAQKANLRRKRKQR